MRIGIDNFYVCEDISSNSHNANLNVFSQLENNPTEPQVDLHSIPIEDELFMVNNNNNISQEEIKFMETILNKIQEALVSNNNIKDEIDLIEKEIETLKANLNKDKIAEFAVNLRSLVVRVNENTKTLTSELETKQQEKENLTKQLAEQGPLIELINNLDFNNMNDDELLETICASNLNLDYLLEEGALHLAVPTELQEKLHNATLQDQGSNTDSVNSSIVPLPPLPPLPPNIDVINNTTIRVNGKTYVEYNAEKNKAWTESIVEDVKSIQQDVKEIQEEEKQAQADSAFEDKAFDIQTKPLTPETINSLNKAYEMSSEQEPNVSEQEPNVSEQEPNVSEQEPSKDRQERGEYTKQELTSLTIIKAFNSDETLEARIEAFHKLILAKENISYLEAPFMTKLKKCDINQQLLRFTYRYYFGPLNYILDNLGSSGKITGPLHSKLIARAKKEKCAEGLKFLKENFSAVIYPNYIDDINKAISYIETDIPW